MNYLCIDVGTTRCKCQTFDEKGNILNYIANDYPLKKIGSETFVDIDAVKENVFYLIAETAKTLKFDSVCISSFGESFVLLDKDDKVLFLPMLYTDPRGEAESVEIKNKFGLEKLFKVTGVNPASMYSVSKLLWIKNNLPEVFKKADKALLICDYIGYVLSGERVIDYALASRTAAFDIEKKCFDQDILNYVGVCENFFSKPMRTGSIVGELSLDVKSKLGIKWDCKLVLGSHDQVCAALGAGVVDAGDAVDGLGTVECITTVFKDKPESLKMCSQGYPVVPFAVDGLYCTYILNYSCSSITNWFKEKIMHGYRADKDSFFGYIEDFESDEPSGLMTLPYFGGASTPYQDINAKGVIIGLTTDTTDKDILKSVMEGTAFEMCLNSEVVSEYGIDIKRITATGGGANSNKWLQIKADIQDVVIDTLRSSEGGLCGCAMLSAVALNSNMDIKKAKEIFVRKEKTFIPNKARVEKYKPHYKKYCKIYETIKNLY